MLWFCQSNNSSVTYIRRSFASEDMRNDCLTKTCTHADWTNQETTSKQNLLHLLVSLRSFGFSSIKLTLQRLKTTDCSTANACTFIIKFQGVQSLDVSKRYVFPQLAFWIISDRIKQMLHLSKIRDVSIGLHATLVKRSYFEVLTYFAISLLKSRQESCKCLNGTSSAPKLIKSF